jgi:hypothetical protein
MALIPHPSYYLDLAPCDFFLFPKMKLKLKGRRFDTTEEIQAETQRMLDTLTEKTSRKRSKNGDGGLSVYMREGTTKRVMAADRPYGEVYDFYSVSPEYFGYTLVAYSHNTRIKNISPYGNTGTHKQVGMRFDASTNPTQDATDIEGPDK